LLRLLVRALGLLSLAGAFAAAVLDGARSLADQQLTVTPAGMTLATLFPDKFDMWSRLVQARLPHFLWDPIILWTLYAPTFLDLGVLGLALGYVSRPPHSPDARSIVNSRP
jgi:hypothetical protein